MAIFRPSARVTLQIRLEEWEDTGPLTATLEQEPPSAPAQQDTALGLSLGVDGELAAVQAQIKALNSQRLTLPASEYQALLARAKAKRTALQIEKATGSKPQQPPNAIDGTDPDGRVVLGQIIPRTVEISRNGLNTADTCRIVLDYADAPIDPRIVRSAGVDVVLGTVSAQDYQRGIRGETRADGSLLSLVEGAARGEPLGTATRFVGWVDEWSLDQSGDDGDTITLLCRDFTALFIDDPLPPGESVDMGLPLDQAIQELLDRSPTTRGVGVFMGRPGQDDPPAAPIIANAVPASRKARRGSAVKRARAGSQEMSVWEHIQDVCGLVGFVPLVVGYDLHIVEPRTFFRGSSATPPRMIYGRNVDSLTFARKLGGVKTPTVEVRCYDPEIGRTRWARFPGNRAGEATSGIFGQTDPPQAVRAAEVTPSGAADDRLLNVTVRGINDSASLEAIATNTWEQVSRQEIEGSLTTAEIDSFDNEGSADLLKLDAGDALEVLTLGPPAEPPVTTTTAQEIAAAGPEQRQAALEALGWRADIAQAIAEATERIGDAALFRVANVILDWDHDQGLTVQVGFINFIVVRLEQPQDEADLLGAAAEALGF